LTKAHVLHGKTNEFLMANIFGCMISILVIAKRGERSQVKKEFMTKFSGRMAAVGKLAFRLNKAVGEEITSSNLFAEVFPPNIDFDPTMMDDTYGERTKESVTGRILCTCALGLQRYVKVSREGDMWDRTTLLKPKIVLDSLLEEMAKA